MPKLKLFPLSKRKENVRHNALKVEPLLNKADTMNTHPPLALNLMKLSPVVSLKKLKILPINANLETSIPFHSLVNMVDSEDITLEKIKTREIKFS